ncbi:MAG: STAS domain-containing protein [Bacteroidia bacterium]|nr:STAS domain-containing protein [Bacteroidia bacterium]
MNFIVRKEENYSCIKVVRDRLDSFVSPELKAELVMLASNQEHNIILDLADCNYCDSSGLSAILVGNRLCEDSEGTFIICNLSQSVEKMIKLAMLDSILLIASNLEEAEKLLFNI